MSVLTKIYVKALPSGEPTRLTSSNDWEFKPAWSPDGQWIAYVTWSMNGGGHVWKMRADGSGQPQRLTQVPAFYTDLAFSPDGRWVVFHTANSPSLRQIYAVPTFAPRPVPVELTRITSGPFASPDALRISVSASRIPAATSVSTDSHGIVIRNAPPGRARSCGC